MKQAGIRSSGCHQPICKIITLSATKWHRLTSGQENIRHTLSHTQYSTSKVHTHTYIHPALTKTSSSPARSLRKALIICEFGITYRLNLDAVRDSRPWDGPLLVPYSIFELVSFGIQLSLYMDCDMPPSVKGCCERWRTDESFQPVFLNIIVSPYDI